MPRLLQIHTTDAQKPATVQLHPSVDVQQLATQLEQAATTNGVVQVASVLSTQIQATTLYVRPAALTMWMIAELTDEEMQTMPTGNWIEDLKRAGEQAKAARAQQSRPDRRRR